jgi:DNA polymerase-3 subunit beta
MKFACETALVARACADLSRIAEKSSGTPILQNILIDAQENTVIFTATDLETTLRATVPADITESGRTTVDSDVIAKYFAAASASVSNFGSDDAGQLEIRSGRSKFRANTLAAADFPSLPAWYAPTTFTVDARAFAACLSGTAFAASSNEARGPALGGLRLKVADDGQVAIAATDGYVLALHPVMIAGGSPQPGEYIIPAYACTEISRLLTKLEKGTKVELAFAVRPEDGTAHTLAVTSNDRTLVVRLVNTQYPNVEQVIPLTFERSAVVPTADFVAALKRSSLAESKSTTPRVTLTLGAASLNLSSQSDLIGAAEEDVDAVVIGDEMSICFNATYLTDVVSRVTTKEMRLEFLGPLSPAVIRAVDDREARDDLFVVMPMRT